MTDSSAAATRARHLIDIGRFDEAKRTLAQALARDPDDADLHLVMARAHHHAGEPVDALAAADRSLAISVSVPALHFAAAAHRTLGRWEESLTHYDRAIAIEPQSARLHVGRALTFIAPHLRDEDPRATALDDDIAAATRACDTAAELDAELAVVPYARGLAWLARGDLPTAASHFEETLRLDPESADAHRLLGTVRARQGMARLASRHLAAAGRLDPTDAEPLSLLRRLARPWSRRARRRGELEAEHLVPDARRILEADLRLRPARPKDS